MAAAALLASTLKLDGKMIMQLRGNGPVPLLVVECSSDLTMRAMAHWHADIQPAPLRKLVGDGQFVITLEPQGGKQIYQGIVPIEGDTLAETLAAYMRQSEQLDTRLWLAANANQCAGFLLQKLPGQPEQDADAWERALHLAATLTRKELLGLPAQQVIRRLYHQEDIRLFDAQPIHFFCPCSRERVANALRVLGEADVNALLQERGEIEADCEFCNRRYVFDAVDARQLFASDILSSPPPLRH
jgi:molecular chaperone Hsp33